MLIVTFFCYTCYLKTKIYLIFLNIIFINIVTKKLNFFYKRNFTYACLQKKLILGRKLKKEFLSPCFLWRWYIELAFCRCCFSLPYTWRQTFLFFSFHRFHSLVDVNKFKKSSLRHIRSKSFPTAKLLTVKKNVRIFIQVWFECAHFDSSKTILVLVVYLKSHQNIR